MDKLFLGFTQQVAHLLPLLLCPQVGAQLQVTSCWSFSASKTGKVQANKAYQKCTYLLLAQLKGTLVLANLQKL